LSPLTPRVRVSLPKIASHSGIAVVAAAITLIAGIGATANKTSVVQVIYVQDKSTFVSVAELKNALPAFQAATSKDFAPLWHIDAKLVYLARDAKVPAGAESITLVDSGPVQGALAYHELVNGVADSIIYVGTAKFYGYSWTVGFTHELWEMLVDPGLTTTFQSPDGRIWAGENADPVEADKYGYTRAGANGNPVLISDFITAKWFGAEVQGPYDFTNAIQEPLVILPGGYAQWWDGITWNLVDNFRTGGLGSDGAFYGRSR
jgi:hypothetical protein